MQCTFFPMRPLIREDLPTLGWPEMKLVMWPSHMISAVLTNHSNSQYTLSYIITDQWGAFHWRRESFLLVAYFYLIERTVLVDVPMATGSSPSLSLSPLELLSSTVKLVGVACSVINLSFQPFRSTEREKKKQNLHIVSLSSICLYYIHTTVLPFPLYIASMTWNSSFGPMADGSLPRPPRLNFKRTREKSNQYRADGITRGCLHFLLVLVDASWSG